jgi:hypothetical protein
MPGRTDSTASDGQPITVPPDVPFTPPATSGEKKPAGPPPERKPGEPIPAIPEKP